MNLDPSPTTKLHVFDGHCTNWTIEIITSCHISISRPFTFNGLKRGANCTLGSKWTHQMELKLEATKSIFVWLNPRLIPTQCKQKIKSVNRKLLKFLSFLPSDSFFRYRSNYRASRAETKIKRFYGWAQCKHFKLFPFALLNCRLPQTKNPFTNSQLFPWSASMNNLRSHMQIFFSFFCLFLAPQIIIISFPFLV